jgi:hypothetical protein
MMLRNFAAILAIACFSADAFVPSRTLVIPQAAHLMQSKNTNFASQLSSPMPKYKSARFMSDAAAEIPKPDKQSILQKVSECFFDVLVYAKRLYFKSEESNHLFLIASFEID